MAVTEASNETMNGNPQSENSEPLIVGTNTTLDYDASQDSNLTYDTENQPLAVGNNLTVKITYAEAELLKEQLGINLDGSDNYLGSNITVIDGDRDWLERIDGNPLYSQEASSTNENTNDSYSWDLPEADGSTVDNGEDRAESPTEASFLSDGSEPLLVGTNLTFVIEEDTDGNSDNSENASLYQRDETTPFALGTNLLLELPDEDGQDSYLGTNLSTIEEDSNSETQTTAMEGDSLGSGMTQTEAANPPSDNGDYAWDFGGQNAIANNSEGMGEEIDADALFTASPWGALEETGAVDGFEDVFPNGAGEIENNSLAGGFGGGEI